MRVSSPRRGLGGAPGGPPGGPPRGPAVTGGPPALALATIILVWAITFAPQLFAGRVFVSGDAAAFRPFAEFSRARWLAEGERTFWNPYVFTGLPATASLADQRPQYLPDAAIDALEWLHRLPGRPPLAGPLLAHLAGMIATGLLARRLWRAGPAGTAWAGIAWGLLPNLIIPFAHGHDAQLVSSSLIPVSLLAAEALFGTPSALLSGGAALALAGTLSLQCLTGHPQIVVYGAILLVAFAIESALRHGRATRLVLATGAGALAMVIAAAGWYPPLLYGATSVRGAGSGVLLSEVANFSHALRDLLSLAWPHAVGFAGATYWGGLRQTDYPQYSGLLVVLLALAALGRRDGSRRGPANLLMAAAVGSAALALGTHLGPLYALLHGAVPLLSGFRVAVAAMIVAQLALALLSARGLERLLAATTRAPGAAVPPRAARVLALIGALALLAGLALAFSPLAAPYRQWALSARTGFDPAQAVVAARAAGIDLALRGLLVAALAGILVHAARTAGRSGSIGALTPAALALVGLLAIDLGSVSLPALARATGGRERLEPPPPTALAQVTAADPLHRALPLEHEWFRSNAWVDWRARSLAGLHGTLASHWDQLMGAGALRRTAALRALAVRYLTVGPGIKVDTTQCEPVVRDGRQLPVLELRGALPRAYVVPRVMAPGSDALVLAALVAPGFDPKSVAYAAEPQAAGDYPGSHAATLRWRVDDPDHLAIECEAPREAFLVVADAHAPGWRAAVDGRETVLYRVNHLVRGVALPAGRHVVAMRYRPEGWDAAVRATRTGLAAWLALAAALALAGFSRRRGAARRGRNGAEGEPVSPA